MVHRRVIYSGNFQGRAAHITPKAETRLASSKTQFDSVLLLPSKCARLIFEFNSCWVLFEGEIQVFKWCKDKPYTHIATCSIGFWKRWLKLETLVFKLLFHWHSCSCYGYHFCHCYHCHTFVPTILLFPVVPCSLFSFIPMSLNPQTLSFAIISFPLYHWWNPKFPKHSKAVFIA